MNRTGWILLHCKLIDSRVFQNEGLLKVWIWCLLKANHEEAWVPVKTGKGKIEVHLKPGQFIFGRKSAAKELKMKPSTVRNRILKLKKFGNLDIQSDTQYSIITIINWEVYQKVIIKRGHPDRTAKGHPKDTNNNDNNNNNITPDIFSLRKRYSNQKLIDRVFATIASTRKSNKVADSVLLAQLQKWERYPIEQVESAIHTYLNKDYASQGKREDYLLGIIRNSQNRMTPAPTYKPPPIYKDGDQYEQSNSTE